MHILLRTALVVSGVLLGILYFYPALVTDTFNVGDADISRLWNMSVAVAVGAAAMLIVLGPSRSYLDYLNAVASKYEAKESEFSELFPIDEAHILARIEKLSRKAEALSNSVENSISPLGRAAVYELDDLYGKIAGISTRIANVTGEDGPTSKLARAEELYKEVEASLHTIGDIEDFDKRLVEIRAFVDIASVRITSIASTFEGLPALLQELGDLRKKLEPLVDDNFGIEAMAGKIDDISDEIEKAVDNLSDDELANNMSEVAGRMAIAGSKLSGVLAQLDTLKKNADALQSNVVSLQNHG
jgi:hypothetical protein